MNMKRTLTYYTTWHCLCHDDTAMIFRTLPVLSFMYFNSENVSYSTIMPQAVTGDQIKKSWKPPCSSLSTAWHISFSDICASNNATSSLKQMLRRDLSTACVQKARFYVINASSRNLGSECSVHYLDIMVQGKSWCHIVFSRSVLLNRKTSNSAAAVANS